MGDYCLYYLDNSRPLGFTGVASGAATIAKVLFGIFLVIAVILVIMVVLGVDLLTATGFPYV